MIYINLSPIYRVRLVLYQHILLSRFAFARGAFADVRYISTPRSPNAASFPPPSMGRQPAEVPALGGRRPIGRHAHKPAYNRLGAGLPTAP